MTVPEAVIGKINTYLGSVGQPRHISPRGQPIATGCREWLLPPGSEGATDFVARDQELRVKLQRLLEDSELTTELEQLASGHLDVQSTEFAVQVNRLLQANAFKNELEDVISQIEALYAPRPQSVVHGMRVVASGDIVSDNPQKGIAPAFWQVRDLVKGDPVTVYRGISSWISFDLAIADRLIVAPARDQFDILRIERVVATNAGLGTDAVVSRLKEVDDSFGIDIVGAAQDCVEFLLRRIPREKEAHDLRKWLSGICPDLGKAPSGFEKRRVALWWD